MRGNVAGRAARANLTARAVGGNVVITTGNGITLVAHARSGVHVVSISGKTEIRCAGGAVSVRDTSGKVFVAGAITLGWDPRGAGFIGTLRSYVQEQDQTRETRVGGATARVALDSFNGRLDLRQVNSAVDCGKE